MPFSTNPDNKVTAKHTEVLRVGREIEALCVALGVGARLPRHTELMERFGASQYNVIRVLEELQRAGRVVRKHGSGTYVTDPGEAPQSDAAVAVTQATVVAISRPDGGFFDRCMEVLYEETTRRGIGLACHFLSADDIDRIEPNSLGKPLGFVVFRYDLAPLGRVLQASGSRVVIVGAPHVGQSFGVPCVCGNHERGAYLLTKHLIDLGHRNIAYADLSGMLIAHSRWQGHSKMLADAKRGGIDVAHVIVSAETIATWHEDNSAVADYFRAPGAPTALVAWNDLEALDLLAALARAGIKVPGDVSVAGYDNDDAGLRVFPALTTVDHFVEEQIAAALDMLTAAQPASPNERQIFAPLIVLRESTGKPKS